MAKGQQVAVKNETPIATTTQSDVPDYLRDVKSGSGLQGLTQDDFIIPRVKLLQAMSDEVNQFENAKPGMFWHNVLNIPLGNQLSFIPVHNRKRYLLLPPIGDSRGVLARSDDAIHWTPPNGSWEIKLKGVKAPVTWATKPTVRESGLAEFGSSNPDDPDSKPAATLFYEYLVFLPDHPECSPVLLSLARSQAKKGKDLNAKIDLRNKPMQAQVFQAGIIKETSDEGDFFNYSFVSSGWATREQYDHCVDLAKKFQEYRAADEDGLVTEAAEKSSITGKEEF